jgi:hypothetical protein
MHSLRGHLVDSPDSLGAAFRRRRWERIKAEFPDIESMRVLDLGGRAQTWVTAPVRPAHVVVVNLEDPTPDLPAWAEMHRADACRLPSEIADRDYDLVFSNSVMEHLGGHANRRAFAETVQAVAPRHYVQTPYRYFPIEPHWLFPGFQFLPVSTRGAISRRWPLVHTPSSDRVVAIDTVMDVELLSITQMRSYFPGSDMVFERVGPLVKSIAAVKR